MAADESLLEIDDEKIIDSFVKLQAKIRGALIRNALCDILRDYEEIVADIEEDMTIHWPSKSLGLPVFKKKTNDSCHIMSHKTNKKQQRPNHCDVNPTQSGRPLSDMPLSRSEIHSSIFPSHPHHYQTLYHEDRISNHEFTDRLQTHGTKNNNLLNQCPDAAKMNEIANGQHDQQSFATLSVDKVSSQEPVCVSREVQTDGINQCVSVNPEKDNNQAVIENPPEVINLQQSIEVLDMKPAVEFGNLNSSHIIPDSGENKSGSENNLFDNEQDCVPVFEEVTPSFYADEREVKDLEMDIPDNIVNQKNKNKIDFDDPIAKGQNADASLSEVVAVDVIDSHGADFSPRNEGDASRPTVHHDLPQDKKELLKLKSALAMELLWIEQAINSRKNYLKLKQQMA